MQKEKYSCRNRNKLTFGLQSGSVHFYLLITSILWLIPFCLRFAINIPSNDIPSNDFGNSIANILLERTKDEEYFQSFLIILENNTKVCIINICGGMLLGAVTVYNTILNGFATADVFVNSHEMGLSLCKIVSITLPHSFELIGLWISGAIGLMIAHRLILFLKKDIFFDILFFRLLLKLTIVALFLILVAAYIETYVSIKILA